MRTAPANDGGDKGALLRLLGAEDFGKASPRRPQRTDGGHRGEEGHEADAVVRRHGIDGEGAGSYEPETSYILSAAGPPGSSTSLFAVLEVV